MDVILREWSPEDLPLMQQTMGDPAMTEHLGGPETPEQLASRHKRYLALAGSGTGHMLAIEIPTAAAPVGSVGYWEKAWPEELVWEIGWAVIPAYQGQGIATHATAAAIERARAERGIVIRYKTRPDAADENVRLVKAVYAALAEARPADLEYRTYQLDDGVSFVHIAQLPDAENPLGALPEFAEFQREITDRCVEQPTPSGATMIGSYSDRS